MLRIIILILAAVAILYFWPYPADLSNFRIASNHDIQDSAKEEIELITKSLTLLNGTPTGKALWSLVVNSKEIYKVYFKSLDDSGARFVKGTPTDMSDTLVWFGRNGHAYRYAPRPYVGDDENYDPAENEIWLANSYIYSKEPNKEKALAAIIAHELTHLIQYLNGEKFRTHIGMLEGDDSWDEVWARLIQWNVEKELDVKISSPLPGEDLYRQQWDEGKIGPEDLHRFISEIYWELDSTPINILNDQDAIARDTLLLYEQTSSKWCLRDRIANVYRLYEAIDERAYKRFITEVQFPQ